jgi:hypothetical protein
MFLYKNLTPSVSLQLIVTSATRRKINLSPLLQDVYKLKSFDCTALVYHLPIMIVSKDSSSMERG